MSRRSDLCGRRDPNDRMLDLDRRGFHLGRTEGAVVNLRRVLDDLCM